MKPFKRPPKRFQPEGYDIIHEDWDLLVGNKAEGYLTVAAKFDTKNQLNLHDALSHYVRKGQAKSKKGAYVVHRLDQGTTGCLIFAKSESAQNFLKDNWPTTVKTYLAVVNGKMKQKKGRITSQLSQDEDYVVHSSDKEGKIAHTEYKVLTENDRYTLVEINLITGRKNQIRVHMADVGCPVVGDSKYGDKSKFRHLALHAWEIEITHPHSRERMKFSAPVPPHFHKLIPYNY